MALNNEYLSFLSEDQDFDSIIITCLLKEKGLELMNHFWNGQYSQFDHNYKLRFFNKTYVPSSVKDPARKHAVVFKKGKYLALLANELNIPHSDLEELDSKPLLKEETYGFQSDIDSDKHLLELKHNEIDNIINYCNETPYDIKDTYGLNVEKDELV